MTLNRKQRRQGGADELKEITSVLKGMASDDKFRRAHASAFALIEERVQYAKANNTDGTETASALLHYALSLVGWALDETLTPNYDVRGLIRRKTDEVLKIIWDAMSNTLKTISAESEALLREMARAEYNALLKEDRTAFSVDRDMLASATDAALTEAAEARAALAPLQAALSAERKAHGKSRYDLGKQLERAQQPSSEVLALRERVTLLERQIKTKPQPEAIQMPKKPVLTYQAASLLEAMSLWAYACNHAWQVKREGLVVSSDADLTHICTDWALTVGTDYTAHLRSLPSVQACVAAA